MLTFYAYSDVLLPVQKGLGEVVLVRELAYLLYTWTAALFKPAFLLFSPWLAGCHDNIMYIAMPEKFVLVTCCQKSVLRTMLVLATFLADLCGILALVISIQSQSTYLPLLAGYAITAISFLPTLYYIVQAGTQWCSAITWQQTLQACFAPRTTNTWFHRTGSETTSSGLPSFASEARLREAL